MLGRDGKLSVVRIGSLIAIVGVLFFLGVGVWFYLDQASRRSPLDITLYPEAEQTGVQNAPGNRQQVYYAVPLAGADADEMTEAVAAHYAETLAAFQRGVPEDERVNCVRTPSEGVYPDYQPGQNLIPYQYKCMFDRSGIGTVQWTEVTVHPGLPEQDMEDAVVIIYDQEWTG